MSYSSVFYQTTNPSITLIHSLQSVIALISVHLLPASQTWHHFLFCRRVLGNFIERKRNAAMPEAILTLFTQQGLRCSHLSCVGPERVHTTAAALKSHRSHVWLSHYSWSVFGVFPAPSSLCLSQAHVQSELFILRTGVLNSHSHKIFIFSGPNSSPQCFDSTHMALCLRCVLIGLFLTGHHLLGLNSSRPLYRIFAKLEND